MSDSIAVTYAKAIDDLAGKIFIPGLIASLLVELGPWLHSYYDQNQIEVYLSCVIGGFIASGLIFIVLGLANQYFGGNTDITPIIALAIMPLGFICLFPEYFQSFEISLSKVSGVALLAWSFVLLVPNRRSNTDERSELDKIGI